MILLRAVITAMAEGVAAEVFLVVPVHGVATDPQAPVWLVDDPEVDPGHQPVAVVVLDVLAGQAVRLQA
ncbi:hypothetical protein D3C86_1825300 [compost metagenome]